MFNKNFKKYMPGLNLRLNNIESIVGVDKFVEGEGGGNPIISKMDKKVNDS